jgi:hypothetical protein
MAAVCAVYCTADTSGSCWCMKLSHCSSRQQQLFMQMPIGVFAQRQYR